MLRGKKKQAQSTIPPLSTAQKQDCKEAFDLFDTDGTGAINVTDLRVALRALGVDPTKDDVKSLLCKCGLEESLTLDFKEYLLLMEHVMVTVSF